MANRAPLTLAEKESIYLGKLQGRTLSQLAAAVGCCTACARKFWRRGRDSGLEGLRAPRRGRSGSGILSRFDARVAALALALKRRHPRWGAKRILVELRRDAELGHLPLPSCSRLALFFHVRCPECVAKHTPRRGVVSRPQRVTGVHEMWQLDIQESIRLHDGQLASVCNVCDPVSGAIIASMAFDVTKPSYWRKLECAEVQRVLRDAFMRWKGLPDGVQTDNAHRLAGAPTDPFPSRLSLWLVGLGIKHRLIRPGRPTDQSHIERCHRTLDGFAFCDETLQDLDHLQQALDRESSTYNEAFPSSAMGCGGQPPLLAHPELQRPRRPYDRDVEWGLFDMQRIYDHLATIPFQRKVSTNGQVKLGQQNYSVGRRRAGQTLQVRFDPGLAQWVMRTDAGQEIARHVPKKLTAQIITGLQPSQQLPLMTMQLAFPAFVA